MNHICTLTLCKLETGKYPLLAWSCSLIKSLTSRALLIVLRVVWFSLQAQGVPSLPSSLFPVVWCITRYRGPSLALPYINNYRRVRLALSCITIHRWASMGLSYINRHRGVRLSLSYTNRCKGVSVALSYVNTYKEARLVLPYVSHPRSQIWCHICVGASKTHIYMFDSACR